MNPPAEASPRERIIAAALAAFAEHGYAAASVQQVAERAGMSKQALLHHYPSKAALRDGVYALLAARLRERFPPIAGELVGRDRRRYALVVTDVFARFCAAPDVARFVVFELLEAPDQLLGWIRAEAAPWLGLLNGVAEQWRTSTDDPTEDAEAMTVSILLTMLAHSALVPAEDPALRRRTLDEALALLLRGGRMLD